jgi:hypothetical protein
MGILKTKAIQAGGGIGARFCGNVIPPHAPSYAAGSLPAQPQPEETNKILL